MEPCVAKSALRVCAPAGWAPPLNCEAPPEREVPPEIERPDVPEPDDVERVLPVWLTPDEWEELLERAGGLEGSPAQPQKTSDAQPIEAPMIEAPKTCLRMQSSA